MAEIFDMSTCADLSVAISLERWLPTLLSGLSKQGLRYTKGVQYRYLKHYCYQ